MERFTYEFKEHFEIAVGGEKQKAEKISLPCPNNAILQHITVLDQEFSKALLKISGHEQDENADKKDSEEMKGSDVVMLMSAGGANMKACYDAMKKIIRIQGRINGKEVVNDHILNQI